jgi:hypothetical protein
MLKHLSLLRALAAGIAFGLVLSFAFTSLAQSGRRVRKSEPVPVSTPEPTPSPTPSSSSEKLKPRFVFLVGLDRRDAFANIPLYAYESVLRGLVDRLNDSPAVQVGSSRSEMGRAEAVRTAKGERESYVILLQVEIDTMSSNSQTRDPDYVIEYSVLAPISAKQLTFGRTYTQAQRNRGGILSPRNSGLYGDRYLNQAAQEAADKILAYFRSHGPVTPLPGKP